MFQTVILYENLVIFGGLNLKIGVRFGFQDLEFNHRRFPVPWSLVPPFHDL